MIKDSDQTRKHDFSMGLELSTLRVKVVRASIL